MTHIFLVQALRQIEGFQVMCAGVCQCVTPLLSFMLHRTWTACGLSLSSPERNATQSHAVMFTVLIFEVWHSRIGKPGLLGLWVKVEVLIRSGIFRDPVCFSALFVLFCWPAFILFLPNQPSWGYGRTRTVQVLTKRGLRHENKAERRACWHTEWRWCLWSGEDERKKRVLSHTFHLLWWNEAQRLAFCLSSLWNTIWKNHLHSSLVFLTKNISHWWFDSKYLPQNHSCLWAVFCAISNIKQPDDNRWWQRLTSCPCVLLVVKVIKEEAEAESSLSHTGNCTNNSSKLF